MEMLKAKMENIKIKPLAVRLFLSLSLAIFLSVVLKDYLK
ncbi:MAG: hypothetical protein UW95_C0008G0027 [Parcubacteria group bacterium GW2011_GWC1_45_14]|nr:MAG: hypothetical protein UW87_C0020G0007 [Candidatus Moranbacteria bacterium GW2011_GWC2_45_10]KKT94818.1 MAG: hypothetical protein UW95_C0008G0027 [Parcubacteria group bacterium GW2011_GWC1_45_14]